MVLFKFRNEYFCLMMNFSDVMDTIRIKSDSIKLKLIVTTGKDNDQFVTISPSIMVSGYGSSEEEAKRSFEHNVHLFCTDLMELSKETREDYLLKLGFSKLKFRNKNFSKLYVDEKGVLQGFEPVTIRTSLVKTTEKIV